MTTEQAIEQLEEMQKQIVHGKRTFGDIADVIKRMIADTKRGAELYEEAHEVPCTCNIDDSTCGHCGKITFARARIEKVCGNYHQL